jgi:hypothetical protein
VIEVKIGSLGGFLVDDVEEVNGREEGAAVRWKGAAVRWCGEATVTLPWPRAAVGAEADEEEAEGDMRQRRKRSLAKKTTERRPTMRS